MRRHHALLYVLLATLSLAVQLPTARAGISYSGDLDPADPNTWTSSTNGYVGKTADGTLTIDADSDLLSRNGTLGFDSGVTGEVLVTDSGSTWTMSGNLWVGAHGNGTLNITNGATVNSFGGVIALDPGSTGAVTVDGAGSTWTNSGRLNVCKFGVGTLNITGGAAVSSSSGLITSRLTAVVTVDGIGSTWTNSSDLEFGFFGSEAVNGTLNIAGGGTVSTESVSFYSTSLLAIDIGNGSSLSVDSGSGEIVNNSTVRVLAGAGATTGGVFSPISATTWSGSGIYQAVGGTWNGTTHEFTVSGVQSGTSGVMETIDLGSTQRALIDDVGTGWSLGASFLAMDTSTTLNFTATAVTGETLTDLEALIGSSESVLGAWELIVAGDGYTAGDPAYLSFDVGAGFSRGGLQVWHYDGTDWTEFDAMDLTYDGAYASFTVTGFSGYAVSTVPEPGTLVLLLVAGLGLLMWVWGNRRSR